MPYLRDNSGTYCKKNSARNLFFDEKFAEDAKDFIEDFIDGKGALGFTSERPTNEGLSKVREVSGDQFDALFVNNKDVHSCLIELKKTDCPACMYMGKLSDIISHKMAKHGYLHDPSKPG